jgi:hypothetical protein
MNSQAPDLMVEFLQKVYVENVLSHQHAVWDVHTNVDRWWVITNPTNLYSQEQFPNMDLAVTFHVGLCLRIPRSEKSKLSELSVEPHCPFCFRNYQQGRKRGQCQHSGCMCGKYVPLTDQPRPVNKYAARLLYRKQV